MIITKTTAYQCFWTTMALCKHRVIGSDYWEWLSSQLGNLTIHELDLMQLADEKHSLLIGFHLVERLQQSWVRRCHCTGKSDQKVSQKIYLAFSTLQSVPPSRSVRFARCISASTHPLHRSATSWLKRKHPTSRSIPSQLASHVGQIIRF